MRAPDRYAFVGVAAPSSRPLLLPELSVLHAVVGYSLQCLQNRNDCRQARIMTAVEFAMFQYAKPHSL